MPAAKFIWGAVGVASLGLTIWGTAEMIHKDLDEKIAALEKDIIRLTIEKTAAEKARDDLKKKVDEWDEKVATADTKRANAETAVEAAKTAVSTAQTAYDTAVKQQSWAYSDYWTYIRGSSDIIEADRLYQKYLDLGQVTTDKKAALDSAKTELSNKKSDLSDAWAEYYRLSSVNPSKIMWQVAKKHYDKVSADLDKKSKELVQRGIEHAIETATIENAKGKTEWAIYTLQTAETNFPEAWSEAMEDSDLATQVKVVRDEWNRKNQETENGEQ